MPMKEAFPRPQTAIAVKACIIENGQILLIQRRSTDVHKPNTWDIPGGRLDLDEDPYLGLKRETLEEVGMEIDIQLPVDVHWFTRDDGQQITMLIFSCAPLNAEVRLSPEHQAFTWKSLTAPLAEFPEWLRPVIQRINDFQLLPLMKGV